MTKTESINKVVSAIEELIENVTVSKGLGGEILGGYFEKYRQNTGENKAARAEQFDNYLIRSNVLYERLCHISRNVYELKAAIDSILRGVEKEA